MQKLLIVVVLTYLGQTAAFQDQIINGEEAMETALQYMASVQVDGKHLCGGFLISGDYVLTAAHCYKTKMSVVLGTHNIKKINEKAVRYNVERICKHNSYRNSLTGNDIMLLKLSRKVTFSKSLEKVKLPTKDLVVKPNTMCLVAGWGLTKTGGKPVDKLRVVNVSTIDLKLCQRQWQLMGKKLPDNITCAGGYETDRGACQGDSGGPLVCNGVATGIVSFNFQGNCDYPNVPNVYTQISKFLTWIKKTLKKKSC
ncbi:mast cell protease 1A-like [Aplochiton taeniatus]